MGGFLRIRAAGGEEELFQWLDALGMNPPQPVLASGARRWSGLFSGCYPAAGGVLVVDTTVGSLGRNTRGLRALSQTAGVPIIMGCVSRDPPP
ncbi:hypothetical protein T484DRAFT_1837384 [Baffinella frigidus]|nr:hypothetical protein T484DRAFT_1837384 [Cryptophyta sp. CCMP2293]